MSWEREFKPCPFCGSEAELRRDNERFDQTQGLTVRWEVRCKRGCVSMHEHTTYKLTDKERFIVCGEDGVKKLRKRWNRRDYIDEPWSDLEAVLKKDGERSEP